jgi:stage III sporulation protein AA
MSLGGGDEPWRVAVVDSRGELGMGLEDPALTVDILTGYPRAKGVEIAARTMNPQLIVCDELGDPREAEAILALQNCGIPFLASAHAGSTEELLRREGLLRLHRGRVFGLYVGLRRQGGRMSCTETPREALS